MIIRRFQLLFAITALLSLVACSGTVGSPGGGGGTLGGLTIDISGLPDDANGNVLVTGPNGFNRVVTSSVVLRNLPEGDYQVAAFSVDDANDAYTPDAQLQTVTVSSGTAARAEILYTLLRTEIPDTTKVLDGHNLVSVDGSVLVFSQSTPELQSLQAGDTVVIGKTSATPQGFIGKVTSVTGAGQVTVETTAATLGDAVKQGSFTIRQTLTPAEVTSSQAFLAGVSPMGREDISPQGSVEKQICPYFDSVELYPSITATGELCFTITLTFDATYGLISGFNSTFTVTASEEASLSLVAGGTIVSIDEKVEVASYNFQPITVQVGPVPVVIVPAIAFYVGIEGEVSAGIKTEVTQSASYTAGLVYADGSWQKINTFSSDFIAQPPTISGNAHVKAFAGPQLELMIYSVTGPTLGTNGYLELNANTNSNPWWTLHGGLEGNVGFKLDVMGLVHKEYHARLFDYRKLIAKAPGGRPEHTLTVQKLGAGPGTITSAPPGIDCGTDCSASYTPETTVILTASPANGSTFSGWSGACSHSSTTCTVTMNSDKSVTASFGTTPPPSDHQLTVVTSGTGSGTITSSPAGITCGSDCTASFAEGAIITLTADAANNSTFDGWSGACNDTSTTCTVTINGNRSVTATFSGDVTPPPPPPDEGVLSVSPNTDLSASGNEGGPFSPSSFGYTLQNIGEASISWTATNEESWLSLSQTSGSLAPEESITVTVSINESAEGLAEGSHSDTVTFTNTTNGNGDTMRSVSLEIGEAPSSSLSVSPVSLTFTGEVGDGPISSQTVTLENTGGSASSYSSDAPSWITVSPESGTIEAGSERIVTVTVDPCTSADEDTVNITFSDPSSQASLSVTRTCDPEPEQSKLEVSPTSLDFEAAFGETPVAKTVTLTNVGEADSQFEVVRNPVWLEVTPDNGTLAPNEDVTLTIQPEICDEEDISNGQIRIDDAYSTASISVSRICAMSEPETGTLKITISGYPDDYQLVFAVIEGPNGYYEEIDGPDISVTVPPGTYTVTAYSFKHEDVIYDPFPRVQDAEVQVGDVTEVDIEYQKAGILEVNPTSDFVVAGPAGGPFDTASYTLTNIGGSPLEFDLDSSEEWVNFEPETGTIGPGESVTVDIEIDESDTEGFDPDTYQAEIEFENSTRGNSVVTTRNVELTIEEAAFEGGELITNGDFGGGSSGWTLAGDFWIGNAPNYRSYPNYAAGGVNSSGYAKENAEGFMRQIITIPSGASQATLTFWYNINSDDPDPGADELSVLLEGSSCEVLAATFDNLDATGSYRQETADVSDCIGETVNLYFIATTDYAAETVFRIDDVSLMVE